MSNTNDNNHVDGLSPEKAFLYNDNKEDGFGSANLVNSWQWALVILWENGARKDEAKGGIRLQLFLILQWPEHLQNMLYSD